jgi:antirestriction protein ArdC
MTNTLDRSSTSKTADRLSEAHDLLTSAVERMATGDDWRRMLETSARFHQYSANNVFLIMLQAPDATRVAGYRTWQSLGRQVRKGEKSIRILAPCKYRTKDVDAVTGEETTRVGIRGFTTVGVFDIGQTDGEEIADVRPVLLEGQAPEGLWDHVAAQVAAAGFTLERGDCEGANGFTRWSDKVVRVRDDVDDAQAVKTLVHELAHVMLHDGPGGWSCRGLMEVEAESVAYLVCQLAGMTTDAYSFAYVARWARDPMRPVDDVRLCADRVIKAARAIYALGLVEIDGEV